MKTVRLWSACEIVPSRSWEANRTFWEFFAFPTFAAGMNPWSNQRSSNPPSSVQEISPPSLDRLPNAKTNRQLNVVESDEKISESYNGCRAVAGIRDRRGVEEVSSGIVIRSLQFA